MNQFFTLTDLFLEKIIDYFKNMFEIYSEIYHSIVSNDINYFLRSYHLISDVFYENIFRRISCYLNVGSIVSYFVTIQ